MEMSKRNTVFAQLRNLRFPAMIRRAAVIQLLLIAACCAFPGYAQDQDPGPAGKSGKNDLKEKWGVEVTAIRLTANDHMIDFRYKVHDSVKAASLFKREIKPRLVHGITGKVLSVPAPAKTGPLRTTEPPKAGRTYWMLFGNNGNLVKKGNEVAVIIGDFRAEKLIVE